jgi:hypothetical protein
MKAAHVRFHSPFEQRVYSFFEKFRELGELRGGADHFLSRATDRYRVRL